MSENEFLKNCPHCGSIDIQIEDNSDPVTGEEDWIIQCSGCGSAFISGNDGLPCNRSELIARWNRRSNPKEETEPGVYFWPMAVTSDGEKLFTYDSVFTLKKALEQFSIWEDHYGYKIKEAWVERTDGKRINLEKRWREVDGDAEAE